MLQLNCNVNADDFEKCQAYILANQPAKSTKIHLIGVIIYVGICALIFSQWNYFSYNATSGYLLVLAGLLLITSVMMLAHWRKRGGLLLWYQKLSGEYQWELNAAGISISVLLDQSKEEPRSAFFAWPQVMALAEDEEAWYVYIAQKGALAVPKRALKVGSAHDFNVLASQYWAAHPDNYGLRLQTHAPTAQVQKPLLTDLWLNITLGLKNAFFIKTHALAFRVRNSQLLALFVLEAIIIAAIEYYHHYPTAMFNVYGVSQKIVASACFILACLVMAYQMNCQAWFTRLAITLQASLLAPLLVYLFIWQMLARSNDFVRWGLWVAFVVWMLLIAYRSIRALFKLPSALAVYYLSVFTFIALVMPELFGQQQFFVEDYTKEAEKYQHIDQEAVYYQQPQFVENTINALSPQRAGVTDLYFVGFAGYGYQKVFANEVKFAQQLFDQKYDTKNRSAMLITHESTLNTVPLANTYNLANVLNGVGKKMDVNEDILFLFLSSHGSKTFELSVSLYPFQMKNLAASDVKKMLDESGIKNRVIVVSACYSGGFIDALKDENTLILTAARKDRTSFGCSEASEFTYFSEAFFVKALQKEKSFTKAFEQAKIMITTREKNEQQAGEHSLPQMFEGANIKPKLEGWLKTLH